jgi:hypothetical protein
LVGRYLELYGRSAYVPKSYQARIAGQVRELAGKYGIGRPRPGYGHGRRPVPERPAQQPDQLPVLPPQPPAAISRPPAAGLADDSPVRSEQLTLL